MLFKKDGKKYEIDISDYNEDELRELESLGYTPIAGQAEERPGAGLEPVSVQEAILPRFTRGEEGTESLGPNWAVFKDIESLPGRISTATLSEIYGNPRMRSIAMAIPTAIPIMQALALGSPDVQAEMAITERGGFLEGLVEDPLLPASIAIGGPVGSALGARLGTTLGARIGAGAGAGLTGSAPYIAEDPERGLQTAALGALFGGAIPAAVAGLRRIGVQNLRSILRPKSAKPGQEVVDVEPLLRERMVPVGKGAEGIKESLNKTLQPLEDAKTGLLMGKYANKRINVGAALDQAVDQIDDLSKNLDITPDEALSAAQQLQELMEAAVVVPGSKTAPGGNIYLSAKEAVKLRQLADRLAEYEAGTVRNIGREDGARAAGRALRLWEAMNMPEVRELARAQAPYMRLMQVVDRSARMADNRQVISARGLMGAGQAAAMTGGNPIAGSLGALLGYVQNTNIGSVAPYELSRLMSGINPAMLPTFLETR